MNVFRVTDPEEIKTLSNDPVVDRHFETSSCSVNWFLLQRSLAVLSFKRKLFPTMLPRASEERSRYQNDLYRRLSNECGRMRTGPDELAPLARWIQGLGSNDEEAGILTQQLLGRLFKNNFTATPESWNAAKILVAAPRSSNILEVLWWFVSGRLNQAKRSLAKAMDGDLSAVNAIGIAVHNIVKGLHRMRSLYVDVDLRNSLSPQAAAARCLVAPVSLYRKATDAGELGNCSFPRDSLFILEIGEASQMPEGRPLVFMEESWSKCPAAQWVPAFFEGLWKHATAVGRGESQTLNIRS